MHDVLCSTLRPCGVGKMRGQLLGSLPVNGVVEQFIQCVQCGRWRDFSEPDGNTRTRINHLPGNHGSDRDSHQGAVLLFDTTTGELLAVIDASQLPPRMPPE